MPTRLKLKHNDRGQVVEALTTAIFGLIFISKITYEYTANGELAAEITWQDTKRIQSIKRYSPAADQLDLVHK